MGNLGSVQEYRNYATHIPFALIVKNSCVYQNLKNIFVTGAVFYGQKLSTIQVNSEVISKLKK